MRARLIGLASAVLALLLLAGPAHAQLDCDTECAPEAGFEESGRCVCVPAGVECVPPDTVFLCEGDVIAADSNQGRIVRVRRPFDEFTNGGTLILPGGRPKGLTTDSRGFVYWTDTQSDLVLRFNPETSGGIDFDVVAPDLLSNNPFSRTVDLEFNADGSFLALSDPFGNPSFIWLVDPISGFLRVGVRETDLIGPFRPSIPQGMAFDPHDPNILYIADGSSETGGVFRVDLSDGIRDPVPLTNTNTLALLDGPGGTEVADLIQTPNDVEVYDPTPGSNTPPDHVLLVSNEPFPNCCGFPGPSDAKVFVVPDPGTVDGLNDPVSAWVLIDDADLDGPRGLALADEDLEDGLPDHLYVSDNGDDVVKRFPISGTGNGISIGGGTSYGAFDAPWDVHVVEDLTPELREPFVVVDRSVNQLDTRVVRLTPDPTELDMVDTDTSNVTTVTPTEILRAGDLDPAGDLVEPVGLCVDELIDGTPVYVATDTQVIASPDLVDVLEAAAPDPASAIAFGLDPSALNDPSRILLGPDDHYSVLDRDIVAHTGRIVRISPDGQTFEDYLTTADSELFFEPAAFAFDRDGVMVVANTSSDLSIPLESFPSLLRVLPENPELVDLGPPLVGGQRVFPVPFDLDFQEINWPQARDMVIDERGDALVVDRNNLVFGPGPGVVRLSSRTGEFGIKSYTSSLWDNLNGIAIDANGELLVAEGGDLADPDFPSAVFRVEPVKGTAIELFDFVDYVDDETGDPIPGGAPITLAFTRADGIALDKRSPAPPLVDDDRDGYGPFTDNCEPTRDLAFCNNTVGPPCHNPDQSDVNGNGFGDVCERNDPDGDGLRELETCDAQGQNCGPCDPSLQDCGPDEDNCPVYPNVAADFCPDDQLPLLCSTCSDAASCFNPEQFDANADGLGDACQPDDGGDGDGIPTDTDGDPNNAPPPVCDDTVIGCADNCPNTPNPRQEDVNDDGVGDACDDEDGDGFFDDVDNCFDVPNGVAEGEVDMDGNQKDLDQDGFGDACDADDDGDGLDEDPGSDPLDNCRPEGQADADCSDLDCFNPGQGDLNMDGFGDVCQPDDPDGDGWPEAGGGTLDNCIFDPTGLLGVACDSLAACANPDQSNVLNPANPLGDACEDDDADGVADLFDNCRGLSNPDQTDSNLDGAGDPCQPDDADMDGIPETVAGGIGPCSGFVDPLCEDNCPATANTDQADGDGDGIGDVCDDDEDQDGVTDAADNCPLDANADQTDTDGDGFGNRCDMDFDGDNQVGLPDYSAFGQAFADFSADPMNFDEQADGNGDGVIGLPDFQIFGERWQRCAGEADPPCPATRP